jgi:hypothetical protein
VSRFRAASVVMSTRALPSIRVDLLHAQVLSCPFDMLIGKRSHKVIAVVIVGLHAEVDALVVTGLLGCLDEVLWQQLTLLIEIVAGTLVVVSHVPLLINAYGTRVRHR